MGTPDGLMDVNIDIRLVDNLPGKISVSSSLRYRAGFYSDLLSNELFYDIF